jgi:DNA-binding MarR family transcriptional regulator
MRIAVANKKSETSDEGAKRENRLNRFDSSEQEVYLNLWRTYDRLRMLEDALFGSFGINCQQYNVLRLLKASHPNSLPTLNLAGRLVSRAPDITRMLDKLDEKGWIRRTRPDGNRRQVLVQITEEGLTLLKSLAEPLRKCHLQQLGHLSEEQRTQLIELLKAARAPHESSDSPWG